MDKTEYWFLDLVVKLRNGLRVLNHPELEVIANRKHHGLNSDEVAEMLYGLCRRGDIITGLESLEIKLSFEGINAGLSGEANIYYGLTPQGGARWEEYSKPDWDRFVDEGWGIDPYEGEISAPTRELVEKHLSFQDIGNYRVCPGSEVWDILSPWEATYWKTLPMGHRLRLVYEPDEKTSWDLASEYQLIEQRLRRKEEYWSLLNWYTNYLTGKPQS
jgi:hypothetical protein